MLMQFYGAVGLAIAGSISGFLIFFLTLHYFGWGRFFSILNHPKWLLIIVALLALEIVLIMFFKQYIFML